LFFYYIAVAKALQPKVVVAENVKGLISGKAKGYVNEIIKAYDEAGYKVQIFLLNAATMGVPQRRERVFFIAHRKDLDFPRLNLRFDEPPILYRDFRTEEGKPVNEGTVAAETLKYRRPGDMRLADINIRTKGLETSYTNYIVQDNRVPQTLTSGGGYYRMIDGKAISDLDKIHIQSFPEDYQFGNQDVQYICGMSVPPVMMAQISSQIYEQWFKEK